MFEKQLETYPLEKTSNTTDYQPNFVLVKPNPNFKFIYKTTFGDVIPVYASVCKLTEVIDFSFDNTLDRISFSLKKSRVFLVLLWTIVADLASNLIYKSFVLVQETSVWIENLPFYFKNLKKTYTKLQFIFNEGKVRSLWFLSLKLSVKTQIEKLYRKLYLGLQIVNKFYLLILILVGVVGLSLASSSSTSLTQNGSFADRLIGNYAQKINYNYTYVDSSTLIPLSLIQEQNIKSDQTFLANVVEYKVQTGDTLDKIAEMYGLSAETVAFNNQITSDQLPEKIYLPPSDSYIYRATVDTKISDLSRIYNLSEDEIYRANETSINRETQSFTAGTLVIIPTNNFSKVAENNKSEDERLAAERAKKITYNVNKSYSIVNYNGTFSGEKSVGMIFPTVWAGTSTSRCIQLGHIACDFANRSEPPIFTVANGKVVARSYESGGYGNYVIIDHGDGLKTLYAHMKEVYVSVGQDVSQGQSIGQMGCIGACTGTHLHFEVIQNGIKQNPVPFLARIP